MTGTEWQNYPASVTPAAADTLLLLHAADESASPSGTVHQVTTAALAAAMVSLFGMQRSFDVVIAPSDASAQFKAASDVVLTGTADQTAINTAVAAMPSPGRALIGPGTVSVTGPIIFNQSYSELHGCGWATYIQAAASFSGAALVNAGSASVLDAVTIQDLQLDGNYGTATGTTVGLLVSAAQVRMSRVEVKNATGAGYYFQAYDGATAIDEIDVRDCYAFTCAGYGMHVGATVENSEFHRVFAVGNYGQGGTVYGSDGIYVEGNNCKFLQCHPYFCNGNGLTIAPGCGNHTIIDGEYETNNGAGIALGDGFYHCAVIGPVFYANQAKSINASGDGDALDLVISGCRFFDIGTSADADKIVYVGGVSGGSVTGNTFDLTGATNAIAALAIDTCPGVTVQGNIFRLASSAQSSIYLSSATECTATGNYLDYQVVEDGTCDYNTYAHNRWRNVGTTPVTIAGASSVALDNLPVADRRAAPSLVTVTASMTITAPAGGYQALTSGTARTALVLTAGSFDGQQVTLVNQGTTSLTWAASGTSHVANGATGVLAAGTAAVYVWDGNSSLWYRAGTGV